MEHEELITGIDLGSSKVSVAIGNYQDGEFNIRGYGISESPGVRGGVVVDLQEQAKCIGDVVRKAESQAGEEVSSVFVGISGQHIRLTTKEGRISIPGTYEEISIQQTREVIAHARSEPESLGMDVIHVLPSQFILDGSEGIKNPVGLFGRELRVKVTTITALTTATQNIIRCMNMAGLEVEDVILSTLATGEVLLYPEEKDLGVGLIDIGGQLTDIAVFKGEAPVYFSSIPYGGENLTRDIATNFHISLKEAERIKKEHAVALRYLLEENHQIEVRSESSSGYRERKIGSLELAEITEKKCEMIISHILKRIEKFFPYLGSGIVLTGGTSLLPGLKEMMEEEADLPVRIGRMAKNVIRGPGERSRESSSTLPYLTCIGLVALGERTRRKEEIYPWERETFYDKTIGKFINWIRGFF